MEKEQRPPAILGIGNPLLDQIIHVTDAYLARLPGLRGGSEPVDYETLCRIIANSGQDPILAAGGSAANTIKGLSYLEQSCALFGKIGKDKAGMHLERELMELGVQSRLVQADLPTGQVVCLLPPNQERTMRYFLGAGAQAAAHDISPEIFEGVKLVHIEGYLLYNGALVEHAMKLAKESGAKISFDTASVETVRSYKEAMLQLIERYVDVLFANEEEAHALTGETPKRSADQLKKLSPTAVVKMGEKGCWAASEEELLHQEAFKVDVKDTTGAGDVFASGFLHGYLENKSLAECAYLGTLVAAQVVQIIGADIPAATWEALRKQIQQRGTSDRL